MDANINIRDFLAISRLINPEDISSLFPDLPKPKKIAGKHTPNDLDSISFQQLCELRNISYTGDMVFTPSKVILDLKEEDILNESFINIFGFANWTFSEIKRINELFTSTNIPPTSEQIRAGIEHLSFGDFGVVDYFAKRMGIPDHETVMRIPWIRIYKCMDIDCKNALFERRLRKEYEHKR